jgi:hypothetical protein
VHREIISKSNQVVIGDWQFRSDNHDQQAEAG